MMLKSRFGELLHLRHYIGGLLFLLWAALFLARLPLPSQNSDLFMFVMAAVGIGAAIWGVKKIVSRVPWRWPPFATVFAVFAGIRVIWLVIAPLPKFGSLDKALVDVSLLVILLFCLQLFKNWRIARGWENALLSLAMIFTAYDLLLIFFRLREWWATTDSWYAFPPVGMRISGGLLEHPNVMSGFLNLVIPIVLTRLIVGKQRSRRLIWSLVLVLFAAVQFFTSSRGGWISGAAGIFVTITLLYFPDVLEGNLRDKIRELLTPKWLLFLFIAGGMFAVLAWVLLGQVQTTPGHGGRLDIWASALQVWGNNIVLGNGTGAFQLHYAQVIQAPPGFVAERAHSAILQFGAEHGLLGIAVLVALVWTGMASWWRCWKSAPESNKDVLAAYAGAGTAIMLHSIVDYLYGSLTYTVGALLIMLFVLVRDPMYEKGKKSQWEVAPIWIASLGIAVVGSWFAMRDLAEYNQGVNDGTAKNWEMAQDRICNVADKRIDMSFYQFQCGLAEAYNFYFEQDDLAALEHAAGEYEDGLATDDYWPLHQANLGMLYWQLGEKANALSALQTAVNRAPKNVVIALNLGWVAEEVEEIEMAQEAYRLALENDPWLAESAFFSRTALRMEVIGSRNFDEYLGDSDRYVIQAYRNIQEGNWNDAEQQLQIAIENDTLNARAFSLLGIVSERYGRHEEAWEQVQIALLIRKTPQVLAWASQVANSQGREPEAADYLAEAFALWTQSVMFSEKYYAGVYHRYFLPADLVPGYRRADLTPEMLEGFHWLIDYYERSGEIEKGREMKLWLEIAGWGEK